MRPKRLPGAQVGERDVASAANCSYHTSLSICCNHKVRFPELGILRQKKELKNSRKRKEERKINKGKLQ